MTLVSLSPIKRLSTLQERMERLFNDPFFAIPHRAGQRPEVDWVPAVDVLEKENALVLKAELPDMDLKDIEIHVERDLLQIRGTRRFEKDEKKENYHRIERVYGTFNRSYKIPDTLDPEKITASYDKGVLTVTLAKKEETKPKKIKVEIKS